MKSLVLLLLLLLCGRAQAHEVRPAYLELNEESPGAFHVLWKIPMMGNLELALRPVFSGPNETLSEPVARQTGSAAIRTWRIRPVDQLRGQTLSIDGLSGTMTDAMVRIQYLDGTVWHKRLSPSAHAIEIPVNPSAGAVIIAYVGMGIEHILIGIDHLLFVLSLLLLSQSIRDLVKTITAFTIAHSMTLSVSALGLIHVPQAPVEAAIALSIVFVSTEILRVRAGQDSLTLPAPWFVAFCFGLLHGFGFAAALAEIGLPEGHIPLALLFFNFGVEMGQLIFIGCVLSVQIITTRTRRFFPSWAGKIPAYLIGSVAMFWMIQRVAAF